MPDDWWSDLDRPPLDPRALRRGLRTSQETSWWAAVDVVDSTASTNADLAASAAAGAAEATVLLAEHQHAGRGRLGRQWQAPPRSALTLSLLLRPTLPAARWPWLSLLAGVAVAEAVTCSTGIETTLKWPNDVLVGARKVAGLLVERVETPTGPAAIVGMGLNVSLRRDELPVASATSLVLETDRPVDRQPVALALLRTVEALYGAWTDAAGDPAAGLHDSYVRRCDTLGRAVRATLPDGSSVHGTAEAIDRMGGLVVATDAGQRTVRAGDVVHLRTAV